MKKILFLTMVMSLAACSTNTLRKHEDMLADGTWKLTFLKKGKCESKESKTSTYADPRKAFEKDEEAPILTQEDQKSCVESFKGRAEARAKELCPTPKFRLFGCEITQEQKTFSYQDVLVCYMKCGENP